MSATLKELYKIRVGIDTLFAHGIRTRLELTNQDKRLFSQVVIDHAIIDYQYGDAAIQLSMQDFGYGKGFFLNNRRTDNPYFNQNALVNYRWHGINPSLRFNNNELGLGIGGNNLNIFLSEVNYQLQSDAFKIGVFGMYVHKDNQYTNMIFHLGYDVTWDMDNLEFRSGFVYDVLPETKHLPQMESWHLINEIKCNVSQTVRLNLSSEHQTYTANKKTDYLYETCVDARYKKAQSYIGVNVRSLPGDRAYTYFWDVNVLPVEDLVLGLFIDYVAMNNSDNYYKFGIQTRYAMK